MIANLLLDIVLLLIAASAIALGALYIFFQKKFKYWSERNVPHGKPKFPLGTLSGSQQSLATTFKNVYDESKHERYYGIWQMHRPTLMVNDPELIKRILVGDFMSFHDHGVYFNEKEEPLTGHLFSLEGTAWRNLRVKLTPTFTSGKMKMMFPLMVACGKEMEQIVKGHAKIGDVIEMKDLTARYSTDIISSCAFGIEANSLKNPHAAMREMGRKIFEPSWTMVLRNVLGFLVPDVAKLINLKLFPKEVSEFFLGTIRETWDYREKNNVKRNDVMQLLMQLKNKGYVDDVDSPNKEDTGKLDKFTFEQAAAQAFIFFIGGFETSSTTMQFTLYELALNQDIQNRVREEIKRVLAKHKGEWTYEAVHEMEYLGRVVDETLRKYPPGFVINRVCTKDYKIPDSDYTIEKGTTINISVFGLQMDERYFPDPDKFDPDRFTEEQKSARHHYTYLPFGEGPRVCIGQRFGLLQTKIGLISILKDHRVDISKQTPIPMDFDPKSIQIAPKGGMHLKVSLLD